MIKKIEQILSSLEETKGNKARSEIKKIVKLFFVLLTLYLPLFFVHFFVLLSSLFLKA